MTWEDLVTDMYSYMGSQAMTNRDALVDLLCNEVTQKIPDQNLSEIRYVMSSDEAVAKMFYLSQMDAFTSYDDVNCLFFSERAQDNGALDGFFALLLNQDMQAPAGIDVCGIDWYVKMYQYLEKEGIGDNGPLDYLSDCVSFLQETCDELGVDFEAIWPRCKDHVVTWSNEAVQHVCQQMALKQEVSDADITDANRLSAISASDASRHGSGVRGAISGAWRRREKALQAADLNIKNLCDASKAFLTKWIQDDALWQSAIKSGYLSPDAVADTQALLQDLLDHPKRFGSLYENHKRFYRSPTFSQEYEKSVYEEYGSIKWGTIYHTIGYTLLGDSHHWITEEISGKRIEEQPLVELALISGLATCAQGQRVKKDADGRSEWEGRVCISGLTSALEESLVGTVKDVAVPKMGTEQTKLHIQHIIKKVVSESVEGMADEEDQEQPLLWEDIRYKVLREAALLVAVEADLFDIARAWKFFNAAGQTAIDMAEEFPDTDFEALTSEASQKLTGMVRPFSRVSGCLGMLFDRFKGEFLLGKKGADAGLALLFQPRPLESQEIVYWQAKEILATGSEKNKAALLDIAPRDLIEKLQDELAEESSTREDSVISGDHADLVGILNKIDPGCTIQFSKICEVENFKSAVLALDKIDYFDIKAWELLQANQDLINAIHAVFSANCLDRTTWNKIRKDSALQMVICGVENFTNDDWTILADRNKNNLVHLVRSLYSQGVIMKRWNWEALKDNDQLVVFLDDYSFRDSSFDEEMWQCLQTNKNLIKAISQVVSCDINFTEFFDTVKEDKVLQSAICAIENFTAEDWNVLTADSEDSQKLMEIVAALYDCNITLSREDWALLKKEPDIVEVLGRVFDNAEEIREIWQSSRKKNLLQTIVEELEYDGVTVEQFNPMFTSRETTILAQPFDKDLAEFDKYVSDNLSRKKAEDAQNFIKACRKARNNIALYGFDSAQHTNAKNEAVQKFRELAIHEDHGKRLAATILLSLLVLPAIYGLVQAAVTSSKGGHADYLFMTQTETAKQATNLFTPYSSPFNEELFNDEALMA